MNRLRERLQKTSFGSSSTKRASVYEESLEMLTGALVIYIFAEIRDLERQGLLTDCSSLPLTAAETVQVIEQHAHVLEERAIDHEDLQKRLTTFRKIQNNTSVVPGFLQDLFQKDKGGVVVTHFMDENAESEMVHAVVVNHVRQRVSLVFRGSVTTQDFAQDAKCVQKKVPNPYASKDVPDVFNLHTGFYQYLFHVDKATGKKRLDIVLEDARSQLEANPGYGLYITGHSLGGALATICGVYAAADDAIIRLVQTVVVYSVASPYCGNRRFRYTHYQLEKAGRLQHLRIANQEDMVTLLPFAAPKATFLSPALALVSGAGVGNLYKHVGINLCMVKVKDSLQHRVTYPLHKSEEAEDDEYGQTLKQHFSSTKFLLQAFLNIVKTDFATVERHHSCDEYEARLMEVRDAFQDRTLDDLYRDAKIVGPIMGKDYVHPKHEEMVTTTRKPGLLSRFRKSSSSSFASEEGVELTLAQAAAMETA